MFRGLFVEKPVENFASGMILCVFCGFGFEHGCGGKEEVRLFGQKIGRFGENVGRLAGKVAFFAPEFVAQ